MSSLACQKLEYNDGFPNLKTLRLNQNTMDVVEIMQMLGYNGYSIFLAKFTLFVVLILVLGMCTIILQTAFCYVYHYTQNILLLCVPLYSKQLVVMCTIILQTACCYVYHYTPNSLLLCVPLYSKQLVDMLRQHKRFVTPY